MTDPHAGAMYTVSPHQLGLEAPLDSEGYLQVGGSQRQPEAVRVSVETTGVTQ